MLRNLLLLVVLGACSSSFAQQESETRSQAPHFIVRDSTGTPIAGIDLPQIATSADVRIVGTIASVTVHQTYRNDHATTLQAEYVFPASTRAAVHGMTMRVGDRVIEAKVKEREAAKQEFMEAQKAGKKASLLEQHRPNVFQMSVANITSGTSVDVELRYTEHIVPEEGVYEFVYPVVVGERYNGGPNATQENWTTNPHTLTLQDDFPKARPRFTFKASIDSPLPLKDVVVPTYPCAITFPDLNRAEIELRTGTGIHDNNNDLVLHYRLADDAISTGLLTGSSGGENFFLLMAEPPQRVQSGQVVPREYVFILDVSGSMNGYPIEVAKRMMKRLFQDLRPQDRFNVLLFAGGSQLYADRSPQATPEELQRAFVFIAEQTGQGGTELLPALERAMRIPRTEGMSRSIVIVTDGFVAVEREAFALIRGTVGDANVFPFGIGSNVNRYLIEGLARAGQGQPFVVVGQGEVDMVAEKFARYVASPVLTDIHVSYEGLAVDDDAPVRVADLFAQRPITIFGRYDGKARGSIVVRGTTTNGPFERRINVGSATPATDGEALRYLWARNTIASLDDDQQAGNDEALKARIIDLGLQYNLLTRFTSFIAVEEDQERDASTMPPGAVPEPHEWAMIVLGGLAFLWFLYRQRSV
ncbi:MAG: VWA domain-containing protein [Flavobacteriales bacterium]|nr:VWA domain-containing protein [Flavobacteriales bacterium]